MFLRRAALPARTSDHSNSMLPEIASCLENMDISDMTRCVCRQEYHHTSKSMDNNTLFTMRYSANKCTYMIVLTKISLGGLEF